MEANEIKAFFGAIRKDIPKVCVMETLWTRLNGKACMVEACPYNGVCEAMMGMPDSLIDRICNDPELQAYYKNDVAATKELYAAVTREEFEELKIAVYKLRQDLNTLYLKTKPARSYAARHEKKYL